VDGKTVGEIKQGFVVLVGVREADTQAIAEKMVKKMLALRIFQDSQGKTNLSLGQVGGELLLVSQFTLYADMRGGNRPSFIRAGDPAKAQELYDHCVKLCRVSVPVVETGIFGAEMDIELVNAGPFTVMLDSDELWPA
jgi:D-tyrosyl-tRNA(Tyr) deacylase